VNSSELRRKLLHMAVGGFAFVLRYLSWPQAALCALGAFLFNWQVLPRLGGRQLWRGPEHQRGYPLGILLYPLSVLGLVLLFHDRLWMAAAIWAVLAWGDGMATLAGLWLGGPRLPWNPDKGWAGSLGFVLFGTLGATLLIPWTQGLAFAQVDWFATGGLALGLAIACALVESAPTTLDDNFTVPLTGAIVLPILALASADGLARPELPGHLLLGLLLNSVLAAVALRARSIDGPGAVSAIVIGTVITGGLGPAGLAVMVAFFVVGSGVTKLGYRIKAARGIAQEKGGARGWRNAWANGGVPAFLAAMAGLALPERGVFALAYAAAVATAAADTCSSEVGKAYGRRTFLITTLRPVPPGTEGAISLEGTLGGALGGALVAAVAALGGIVSWPAAALVALAGLLGSLAESVLGTVAEARGWMGNDALNALNTAIGAGIAVLLAHAGGSLFP
jgi:uncharacterized protein (TIGR00297 family)